MKDIAIVLMAVIASIYTGDIGWMWLSILIFII
jgi:hypothetical protein